MRRQVRRQRPDVVLEIQDIGVLDSSPYLVMQDLSYGILLDRYGPTGVPHFRSLGRRRIEALKRRQEIVYQHASALLPMSRWLASHLEGTGASRDKIHVVNPGINMPVPDVGSLPVRRLAAVKRLIMVGRDFDTKGGAQVVAAFALLRKQLGRGIELTIVGPKEWPLRGAVPDGVTFLGQQPVTRIPDLLDAHDLFVMPSLFEGFGIAFVEALVRGLPCIGRDDCAMPEIIDTKTGGRLVGSDDAEDLADLILDALDDDSLYAECARLAPERLAHYSWQRAASQVLEVAHKVHGAALIRP